MFVPTSNLISNFQIHKKVGDNFVSYIYVLYSLLVYILEFVEFW